ncbi:MAG: hypothetical protein B7Z73_09720 [Planctomycetia bacterium 21-64-5]|nr:MAG: hypothetical protein B7Z73_09720 [Planctomycetia bacterium 21-64-5]HQU46639.1 hypothetical protein [Pirellulales bacterium]
MTAALLAHPFAQPVPVPAADVAAGPGAAPRARGLPLPFGATEDAGSHKKTRRPKVPEPELAELSAQAQLHNQRIVESELSVLDDYWLLGRVLERVRGNFPHGTWQPWLDRRHIDRTRAKRARLLAQVFASTEEMAGLTLHEALKLARLRKKAKRGGPEPQVAKKLKSTVKRLLGIVADLIADDSPQQYSPLAAQLAEATAAICRACRGLETPPQLVERSLAQSREPAS